MPILNQLLKYLIMTIYKKKPLETGGIKRYSLSERPSKVSVDKFAKPYKKGAKVKDYLDALPGFLAAADLREIAGRIADAHRGGRAIIIGMGAHPIKVGLNPLLIQWMEAGLLSTLAVNGAAMVHDFEIAFQGATSEEVGAAIDDGSFGMARETGEYINNFVKDGVKDGLGLGESLGRGFTEANFKYNNHSLFYNAYKHKIPVTVHVAMGTDVIHYHPEADPAAIGEGSHRDFRLLAECCRGLDGGGVFINLGSAVVIPEVFLKTVTLLRNLGTPLETLYTLNMDFVNNYRPRLNVVQRPTQKGGKGYNLYGHHEIMFPLLTAAVMENLK